MHNASSKPNFNDENTNSRISGLFFIIITLAVWLVVASSGSCQNCVAERNEHVNGLY